MMGLSRQETSEQPVANHPMRRKTKMKHKISENPGHKSSKRQLHLLLKEMECSALAGQAHGFQALLPGMCGGGWDDRDFVDIDNISVLSY